MPQGRLLSSLNAQVFDNSTPPIIAVNFLVVAVLAITLWPEIRSSWLIAFGLASLATVSINIAIHRAYARADDAAARPETWQRLLLVGACLNGATWGIGLGGILWQAQSLLAILLPLVVIAGMIGVYVASQSASIGSIAAFMAATLIPMVGVLFLRGGPEQLALTGLIPLYAVVLFVFAFRNHRQIVETLTLRFQNEALLADLLETEKRLIEARNAAQDMNRAKSRFLAMMSHELRTPLNAILGFSDIIANEQYGPVGEPRYADYARDIHTSGRHLLELVNDILDLSKIESGRMEIEAVELDLADLCRTVVRLLRVKVDESAVVLKVDIAPDARYVSADRRAVNQILVNLVANAIKFTPSGSISIRARRRDAETVSIAVEDTGIGIDPDDQERILTPFEQADNSYTRTAGGTGLGLPLAKSLAELHGGTLTLTSRPNDGTLVELTLPAAASQFAGTHSNG